MGWIILSDDRIEETQTGLAIDLIEGTWEDPIETRPEVPKSMTVMEKAMYIRSGLHFAKEFMKNRGKFRATG